MNRNGTDVERVTHPIETAKVKTGDLMAFINYAKVIKVLPGEIIEVKSTDSDMEFQVIGSELIERGYSADQYKEEIKVTKTKAAELLISSHDRPFTVCFDKADGEERILRGRLVIPEPLLGRSMCEDLDLDDKHKLRLVDHRTIKWLVVEGVRYTVK